MIAFIELPEIASIRKLGLSPNARTQVDDVAKAAVAGAAGRATGILESHDAILAAR